MFDPERQGRLNRIVDNADDVWSDIDESLLALCDHHGILHHVCGVSFFFSVDVFVSMKLMLVWSRKRKWKVLFDLDWTVSDRTISDIYVNGKKWLEYKLSSKMAHFC